jgi:pyruvate kinase
MPHQHASLEPVLLRKLLKELGSLRQLMIDTLAEHQSLLAKLHPEQAIGAANLLQYLAFRSRDVRKLQDTLHELGLSSMASAESHICAQLEQIMLRLGWQPDAAFPAACCYHVGKSGLDAHTRRLFGPQHNGGIKHVMVTLDESSGGSVELLEQALIGGMTVARINCAHDGFSEWERWIGNVRDAGKNTGLTCSIYMDLPGPKMRLSIVKGANRRGRIKLKVGDEIRLVEQNRIPETRVKAIACQEAGIVAQLKTGAEVAIDDGKYTGQIVRKGGACWIRLTRVHGAKPRIEDDKGINFPHAKLKIPLLTARDRELLPFIARHADLMGASFIRTPADVAELRSVLRKFPRQPELILKIETPEAVLHLPDLLLEAMQDRSCGVMIARGDLAVELGFTHLGDAQDKLLWLCEAAHVPVVWATQVLESLNKTGLATRSEITDAAQAFKAECVMLNKGGYLLETIATLQEVMQGTDGQRRKKRYTLAPLPEAGEFFARHPRSKRKKGRGKG